MKAVMVPLTVDEKNALQEKVGGDFEKIALLKPKLQGIVAEPHVPYTAKKTAWQS
ncbi:hypothetical protein [Ereboglobus luteus]|uniref:hypothetical protein n=1 Tax=Ereboglobus luteus TaxID=1796921 RepID=UPI001F374314|nr:hypothetical protein [Ereboglobus luteus]